MKIWPASTAAKLGLMSSVMTVAATVGAVPAAASGVQDGFSVLTQNPDHCTAGKAMYIDHGPGLPGGGTNDDYMESYDLCSDHHGVKTWVWLTRGGHKHYLGGAYNPYGDFHKNHHIYMAWDPFKKYGNVKPGDYVGVKVCVVDGDNDPTPSYCDSETRRSVDG